MNKEIIIAFLKLIILLPTIIFLIYISIKYSSKYINNMSNGRLIKIIDRVPLSQHCFLNVVMIKDKPYVISSGEKGAEILLELDIKDVEEFINDNKSGFNPIEKFRNINLTLFKRKDE